MAELTIQAECFQWHWNTFINERRMLFHVQNKAKNRIEGSKFKAMGVVKGVSDFVYISPKGIVFIEMKTKEDGSRQSEEQIDFQSKVEARGYRYEIARTFEEFQRIVVSLHYE